MGVLARYWFKSWHAIILRARTCKSLHVTKLAAPLQAIGALPASVDRLWCQLGGAIKLTPFVKLLCEAFVRKHDTTYLRVNFFALIVHHSALTCCQNQEKKPGVRPDPTWQQKAHSAEIVTPREGGIVVCQFQHQGKFLRQHPLARSGIRISERIILNQEVVFII